MKLKLARCTIRDWRMDDAESLAKHANNRRVSINLHDRFPFPYGIEDAKSFIERTLRDQPEKNFVSRLMVRPLAQSESALEKIFFGTQPRLVIGRAKNFGGVA